MKVTKAQFAACGIFAFSSLYTLSQAGPQELLLSGPVEAVDLKANKISVLGHQIAVRDASAYSPGGKINVFGDLSSRGVARMEMVQRTNRYAASGDAVVVVGKVSSVDKFRARVSVDGANVDYTALLASAHFGIPSVGDAIRIVGTQPSGEGVILATKIVAAAGVTGSALLRSQGVTGSAQAAGVTGSAQAVGVTGSALLRSQGVTGSAQAAGVTGSAQAVGVTGSALLRSQGVTGSAQAAGVTGSAQAAGVTGSAQAAGVTGSAQAAGVTGSAQAAGVTGSALLRVAK